MANYYGYARSNYFSVKDINKFQELCDKLNLEKINDESGRVGFYSLSDEGLNTEFLDHDTEEIIEIDVEKELSDLLQPGEVAIIMQIGYKKMRYFTGWAWAINSEGKIIRCDLSEIYERAKTLNPKGEITLCEY